MRPHEAQVGPAADPAHQGRGELLTGGQNDVHAPRLQAQQGNAGRSWALCLELRSGRRQAAGGSQWPAMLGTLPAEVWNTA